MDYGHKKTDEDLAALEKRIAAEYKTAVSDMEKKLSDWLIQFDADDKKKKKQLADGKITQKKYNSWRIEQIMLGETYEEMLGMLCEDLTNVNQIAASIINGHTPEAYALNHNYGTFEVETGALVDTSYSLYDRQTVERLLRDNPDLIPKAAVKVAKDKKWNKQKINSAILQGILQGETIEQMAGRLQQVGSMNLSQAIRNARTMTTSAENGGRVDSYIRAQDMGIELDDIWLSTVDGRTRHSHRQMDGEKRAVGEVFSNGCRFPGDPEGRPEEVYNCRCTLIAAIRGFTPDVTNPGVRHMKKLDGMSYQEWKDWHTKKR